MNKSVRFSPDTKFDEQHERNLGVEMLYTFLRLKAQYPNNSLDFLRQALRNRELYNLQSNKTNKKPLRNNDEIQNYLQNKKQLRMKYREIQNMSKEDFRCIKSTPKNIDLLKKSWLKCTSGTGYPYWVNVNTRKELWTESVFFVPAEDD